jgi:hypothetical protein
MPNSTLANLIAVFLPTIFPFVITLAVAAYKHLVERLPLNVHDTVTAIVATAVQGVEQSTKSGIISKQDRKDAAMNAVNELLKHYRISIPESFVDLAIEAAVTALPVSYHEDPQTPVPTLHASNSSV